MSVSEGQFTEGQFTEVHFNATKKHSSLNIFHIDFNENIDVLI